jgi:hypothetical protein
MILADDAGNTDTGISDPISIDIILPTLTASALSVQGATGEANTFILNDTATARWDNSATGNNNADTITSVTFDLSDWVSTDTALTGVENSGIWTADITDVIDTQNSGNNNVIATIVDDGGNSVTVSGTNNYNINNIVATVTDANISITGGTGNNGDYIIGDTVIVTWNNSASGDNNNNIYDITADLSGWGGGASVTMTDTSACGGTPGNDIYEACYTLVSGNIDSNGINTSVTVTNFAGARTTDDTSDAVVDNEPPVITDNGTLTITADFGITGVAGFNNRVDNQDHVRQTAATIAETDGETTYINLSSLTGQSAVQAGVQSGPVIIGTLDDPAATFTITVVDNSGNTATTISDPISVDNTPLTVTPSYISVTGATGDGGLFVDGDVAVGRWDNSASGENNADGVSAVYFDLSDWVSTDTNVTGSEESGVWTASITQPLDFQNDVLNNVIISAYDDAGNLTTTTGTNDYGINNYVPVITDANVWINSGTGTDRDEISGIFIVGNQVRVYWNNTPTGDGNAGITQAEVDLSPWGIEGLVPMTDDTACGGTAGDEIWIACATVPSGSEDAIDINTTVTVYNIAGSASVTDSSNAKVDNQPPVITDNGTLQISTDNGVTGVAGLGDRLRLVNVQTEISDNDEVTIDLRPLTTQFDLAMGSQSSSINDNTLMDTAGIDFTVTVRDNANNVVSFTSNSVAVDNIVPDVTGTNITVTGASGPGGLFIDGDSATAYWDNTASGENNSDEIIAVTINMANWRSVDGALSATNTGDIWSAEITGDIDLQNSTGNRAGVIVYDNAGNTASASSSTAYSINNVIPVFGEATVTHSGATGYSSTYKIGDEVVITWDNSETGSNQADILSVTADFSGWGGGSEVIMTDTTACGGTAGNNIYEACYTVTAGNIDATNVYAYVTANNIAGSTTTQSQTSASVDNKLPVITDNGTLTITTDNVVTGVAAYNNNSDNQDRITQSAIVLQEPDGDLMTVNFSGATGQTAVPLGTESGPIIPGTLDDETANFIMTVIDNAGNSIQALTDVISVDNQSLTVTPSLITVTGGNGPDGLFIVGDDSGLGDNNPDDVSSVTFDLSDFVTSDTAVAGVNNSNIWTASTTGTLNIQNDGDNSITIHVVDSAGNESTVASSNDYGVNTILPTLTDANISVNSGSGRNLSDQYTGTFIVGDTVVVTWNNTSSGDNNAGITGATVDLSGWGGGTTEPLTDTTACGGTAGDDIYLACRSIVEGELDADGLSTSVTVSNIAGSITVADSAVRSIDNDPPRVLDNGTLDITTDYGVIGVMANNSGYNKDRITQSAIVLEDDDNDLITVNFSPIIPSQDEHPIGAQSGTMPDGFYDGTRTFTIRIQDDDNNVRYVQTDPITIDNYPPEIDSDFVTITGNSLANTFVTGDTVYVQWNDSHSGGDANNDVIGEVRFNLSKFVSTDTAVAGVNTNDVWTASISDVLDSVNDSGNSVTVTIYDNGGNTDSVTIGNYAVNAYPVIQSVTLPATSNIENLDVSYNITPIGSFGIVDWKKNGNSVLALNMPFEANSGSEATLTRDYSENANNGTVNNALWYRGYGLNSRGVYEFNGTDSYITLGDADELDFGADEDFTVEAWINSGDVTNDQIILEKVADSGALQGYQMAIVNSRIEFYLADSFGNATFSSNTVLSDDTWYHVMFVFNRNGEAEMYINGTLDSSQDISGVNGDLSNTASLEIGRSTATGDYFDGRIDEIRIFNYAVSNGQAEVTYNSGQANNRIISYKETTPDDEWQACVIPSDKVTTGSEVCSSIVTITNSEPLVTDGNITINTGTGTDGTFIVGDELRVVWDNTVYGDNNLGLTSVAADLTEFDGLADVPMTDTTACGGTAGDNIYELCFTIPEGDIDVSSANVAVVATNAVGSGTGWDTTDTPLDNQLPYVSNNGQLNITVDNGIAGVAAYNAGTNADQLTQTAIVYEVSDGDTATIDLSALTGNADLPIGTQSDPVVIGTIDSNAVSFPISVTDNAGNTIIINSDPIQVDNLPPVVTPAHIAVAGASGTSGEFIVTDIVEASWDAGAEGETDIIDSVYFDFSDFLPTDASVSATLMGSAWTAYTTDSLSAVTDNNNSVTVTVVDNGGNEVIVTDDGLYDVDGRAVATSVILPEANDAQNLSLEVTLVPDSAKSIVDWKVDTDGAEEAGPLQSLAVLNMPFEGNDGNELTETKDYSEYANDGIVNGATWSAMGGVDGYGYYYFDGNDCVQLPQNFMANSEGVSVQGWFRTTDSTPDMTLYSIEGLYELRLNTDDTGELLAYFDGDALGDVGSGVALNDGSWHQFVVTSDSLETTLYIDGELVDSKTENKADQDLVSLTSAIGGSFNCSTDHFVGDIDEIVIYNRVLSESHVALAYNNGTPNSLGIHNAETEVDEIWQACVTPTNGVEDGNMVCSNEITITPKSSGGGSSTPKTPTDEGSDSGDSGTSSEPEPEPEEPEIPDPEYHFDPGQCGDTSFTDISDHWAKHYIMLLECYGIVEGVEPGLYMPENTVTRAELTKVALLLADIPINTNLAPAFTDIRGHWSEDYVNTAANLGIVQGVGGRLFAPDAKIDRAAALKILLLATQTQSGGTTRQYFNDTPSSEWYTPYVNRAYQLGIVSGFEGDYFRPANLITRGEMAKMAALLIAPCERDFDGIENNWARNYIAYLECTAVGENEEQGVYAISGRITRAEMVKIAMKIGQIPVNPRLSRTISDIGGAWYEDYLNTALDKGLIVPDSEGRIWPNRYISRAEALKLILYASGNYDAIGRTVAFENSSSDNWFMPSLDTAQVENGFEGRILNPDTLMRHGEMAAITTLLLR